jgi:hypothetical protein
MEDKKADIPLPENKEGSEKNIEAVVEATNIEEARRLFQSAKKRLLDVNQWHDICGKLSAEFELTDDKGNHASGNVKLGNYFKIDIPGLGSASGEGYDWVKVEEVKEENAGENDTEYVLIRVRPSENPTTSDDNVAHFFSDKATSNFVVKREKNVVTAAVYGRNEVPNTSTNNTIDKLRNGVVGTTALAGMSNPQWKTLANAVVGKSQ